MRRGAVYINVKEFAYDHVSYIRNVPFKKGDVNLTIRVNPQRRLLKAILFLFMESFTPGTRDSENYINPDLEKVSVTMNGSPSKLYNSGFERMDTWEVAKRFFGANARGTQHMNAEKFYTDNKFCLLIDLRSMEDHNIHGSGTHLVNTQDGIQLEIKRNASGSGTVNCHLFVISDSQMNIMGQQLESLQY